MPSKRKVTIFPFSIFFVLFVVFIIAPVKDLEAKKGNDELVLAKGTIVDATGDGNSLNGEVFISVAGGTLGEFKRDIKSGDFNVAIEKKKLPEKLVLPLMIKLSFHVKDTKKKTTYPPRHIEHLSPRLPQNLNVVVYTDAQLEKANAGQLFSELQQIEESVLVWNQSDKNFKAKYIDFYSSKFLETRLKLVSQKWGEAAAQAKLPVPLRNYVQARMDEKTGVGEILKFLPE